LGLLLAIDEPHQSVPVSRESQGVLRRPGVVL
jgi:hypothetical protein